MQMGQVIMSPIPRVTKPTIALMIHMMTPPKMVEYNIPKGPNKTVKIIETPMLFVDVVTTVCGCSFAIVPAFLCLPC